MPLIQWIMQNLNSAASLVVDGSGGIIMGGTAVALVHDFSYDGSGTIIVSGTGTASFDLGCQPFVPTPCVRVVNYSPQNVRPLFPFFLPMVQQATQSPNPLTVFNLLFRYANGTTVAFPRNEAIIQQQDSREIPML